MTMRPRIALVRYPADYFHGFGLALESAGFDAFWITSLRSDSQYLRKRGILVSRILDTSAFDPRHYSVEECQQRLAELETVAAPRINDILLMDRVLRRLDYEVSLKYVGHLERVLTEFLRRNRITLVTSWRDTALQLICMLVCRREGIPWVVPTRARIPQDLYGFCVAHHTASFINLRSVSSEDVSWAQQFLKEFELKTLRPGIKRHTKLWRDVARMLPTHATAFINEARRAVADYGNSFARYALPDLIYMYVRRRLNLALYKAFSPCKEPRTERFCLYTLHTQPESSIDVEGSYYSDQVGLITAIARSLPASHRLYVKVHPGDVDGQSIFFYRQVSRIPSVTLIDYRHETLELVKRSSIVFTLTGTVGYEAALLNTPVISFAKNFYNALPGVRYCSDPTTLPTLIDELLTRPRNADRQAKLEFLAKLRAACFEGEVSRSWKDESLSTQDLEQLSKAYRAVGEHFVCHSGGASIDGG